MYVPSPYEVKYHENGTIEKRYADTAHPHSCRSASSGSGYHVLIRKSFVVPSTDIVFDRAMIELFRGCPRGCDLSGWPATYRPLRTKSKEVLLKQAQAVLKNSGYEEISVLAVSPVTTVSCRS